MYEEKKIEEMPVVFMMDRFGYSKTIDMAAYERNKEAVHNENKYIIQCMNTGRICVFTNTGRMHMIRVMDVPFGKFRDKGTPIDNLCNYDSKIERMVYVEDLAKLLTQKLVFGTKNAFFKIVDGSEFNVSKRTIAATKLNDDDELIGIAPAEDISHIVIQSHGGYFLKFSVTDIPEKKKGAVGVRGMSWQTVTSGKHSIFSKTVLSR